MATTLEFLILAKDQASDAFDKIADKTEKMGSKFDKFQAGANIALGAVAVGVGVFAKQSMDAYADAEESQQKLQFAYDKFPATANASIESLRELNGVLQAKTGIDADDTAAAQASLAAYGLTGQQIAQLTPLMQDYAAKTGKDIATAADDMGKAMLGSGKALKSVGVDFTDAGSVAGNFDQVMAGLTDKVGGTAEMMGGTAAGKSQILQAQWGDLQEMAGAKLLPALTKITDAGIKVTDWMGKNEGATAALAIGIGVVSAALAVAANWATIMAIKSGVMAMASGISTAAQWLWNAAMSANPIGLIILGIAALVAGILWLWNNNEGFRNFIIAAWAGIKAAFSAVVDWVVNVMVPWFKQAFDNIGKAVSAVVAWITKAWNDYVRGLQIIVGWIGDAVGKIVKFFTDMPGNISRAAGGMWDGIVTAFKAAINTLIRLWNNLQLTIGGGSILGVAIPSVTLDTPNIPYLASGGTIARGGAAVVGERGSELVTMPTGAHVTGSGATVNLDDSTINRLARALAGVLGDAALTTVSADKWSSSMARQAPGRGR